MAPIHVHYLSRRSALAGSKADGGTLTLFIPTTEAVFQGSTVDLFVGFGDAPKSFRLHGVALTGTQALGRDGVGGVLVGFLGDHKRRAAEMLAFCAQRPPNMGTALRERLSLRMRCAISFAQGKARGFLLDLSQSGAFVASSDVRGLRPGASVRVKLGTGLFGMGGTWVEGRVIWQGKKDATPGVGLRFTGQDARQNSTIQKLLARASAG